MKVMCIVEPNQAFSSLNANNKRTLSPLKCGEIYTVVSVERVVSYSNTVYELEEVPPNPRTQLFCSSLFSPLSDIDELELVNEKELVCS